MLSSSVCRIPPSTVPSLQTRLSLRSIFQDSAPHPVKPCSTPHCKGPSITVHLVQGKNSVHLFQPHFMIHPNHEIRRCPVAAATVTAWHHARRPLRPQFVYRAIARKTCCHAQHKIGHGRIGLRLPDAGQRAKPVQYTHVWCIAVSHTPNTPPSHTGIRHRAEHGAKEGGEGEGEGKQDCAPVHLVLLEHSHPHPQPHPTMARARDRPPAPT